MGGKTLLEKRAESIARGAFIVGMTAFASLYSAHLTIPQGIEMEENGRRIEFNERLLGGSHMSYFEGDSLVAEFKTSSNPRVSNDSIYAYGLRYLDKGTVTPVLGHDR